MPFKSARATSIRTEAMTMASLFDFSLPKTISMLYSGHVFGGRSFHLLDGAQLYHLAILINRHYDKCSAPVFGEYYRLAIRTFL